MPFDSLRSLRTYFSATQKSLNTEQVKSLSKERLFTRRSMGSLNRIILGNLSLFASPYYIRIIRYWQPNSRFREVLSSLICPICPIFLGEKLHNFLSRKEMRDVHLSMTGHGRKLAMLGYSSIVAVYSFGNILIYSPTIFFRLRYYKDPEFFKRFSMPLKNDL